MDKDMYSIHHFFPQDLGSDRVHELYGSNRNLNPLESSSFISIRVWLMVASILEFVARTFDQGKIRTTRIVNGCGRLGNRRDSLQDGRERNAKIFQGNKRPSKKNNNRTRGDQSPTMPSSGDQSPIKEDWVRESILKAIEVIIGIMSGHDFAKDLLASRAWVSQSLSALYSMVDIYKLSTMEIYWLSFKIEEIFGIVETIVKIKGIVDIDRGLDCSPGPVFSPVGSIPSPPRSIPRRAHPGP
ncbi:hypothetical protein Cgig2_013658 [Carnegiea gigantea]|uniref:Uncharacterized protein n=1 Tax=Carnegiea gigantea TaxID=171969 RepID=A0A9Q1Q8G4_9CARY|nr:hypothetical protein Cgig2_013658 [Carnegiea gigantea]